MLSENMTDFFNPDEVGNQATVGASTINGFFSREYAELNGVEGYYPIFIVTDADADTVTLNSTTITLQAVNYLAISKRPDGTGLTTLLLQKQ